MKHILALPALPIIGVLLVIFMIFKVLFITSRTISKITGYIAEKLDDSGQYVYEWYINATEDRSKW